MTLIGIFDSTPLPHQPQEARSASPGVLLAELWLSVYLRSPFATGRHVPVRRVPPVLRDGVGRWGFVLLPST